MEKSSVKKGIYLVTNGMNFKRGSGAYAHVEVGILELSKYYSICTVDSVNDDFKLSNDSNRPQIKKQNKRNKKFKKTRGTLSDIKRLVDNHRYIYRTYIRIKKENPDFIYERAEYLSFSGVIISKVLNIPHFYEINGIAYRDIQSFYSSFLNKFAKQLELFSYKTSTYNFCVGGIGLLLPSSYKNWTSVQNGIEKSAFNEINLNKDVQNKKITIVFLANLMPHHDFQVLVDALCMYKNVYEHIQLNLVGANFEEAIKSIPRKINFVYHGILYDQELERLLEKMDYGIIPFARDYDSHVKLFHYASAGLPIIIPNSKNFMNIFDSESVDFFENGDAISLADKLSFILTREPYIKNQKSNKIYELVKNEFTWEKIYGNIHSRIEVNL